MIKLGSSIVADDDGELRSEVLARICDVVAGCTRAGEEVVIVTSGAIARGMRVMGLASARQRSTSCRPPARSARASSTASTTSCCASAG